MAGICDLKRPPSISSPVLLSLQYILGVKPSPGASLLLFLKLSLLTRIERQCQLAAGAGRSSWPTDTFAFVRISARKGKGEADPRLAKGPWVDS